MFIVSPPFNSESALERWANSELFGSARALSARMVNVFGLRVSGVWLLVSGLWCLETGTWLLVRIVCRIVLLVAGVWSLVPGIGLEVPGVRCRRVVLCVLGYVG